MYNKPKPQLTIKQDCPIINIHIHIIKIIIIEVKPPEPMLTLSIKDNVMGELQSDRNASPKDRVKSFTQSIYAPL